MSRKTKVIEYDFRGNCTFPATGAGVPWVKTDTSSAGAPTILALDGGGVRFTLDSGQTEVENLCLSFGDALSFDIDDIIRFWFIAKTAVAVLDSNTQIAFGMAGARNDAIDSIAQAILFRAIGSNALVVESDDGTSDNDDVATGLSLSSSWRRFEVNLAERNSTREPPSLSLGRKSNIGFYGANSLGSLRRVASGTRFDMSAYTGGLQPFMQVQKASDSNGDTFDVLKFGIEINEPQ